jgi:hypothetical protein
MLSKPGKAEIRAGASKNLGISRRESASALAFERPCDDRRPAASATGLHDLVNEVNELIWKTNGYLLAHPKTVANPYQPCRAVSCQGALARY